MLVFYSLHQLLLEEAQIHLSCNLHDTLVTNQLAVEHMDPPERISEEIHDRPGDAETGVRQVSDQVPPVSLIPVSIQAFVIQPQVGKLFELRSNLQCLPLRSARDYDSGSNSVSSLCDSLLPEKRQIPAEEVGDSERAMICLAVRRGIEVTETTNLADGITQLEYA